MFPLWEFCQSSTVDINCRMYTLSSTCYLSKAKMLNDILLTLLLQVFTQGSNARGSTGRFRKQWTIINSMACHKSSIIEKRTTDTIQWSTCDTFAASSSMNIERLAGNRWIGGGQLHRALGSGPGEQGCKYDKISDQPWISVPTCHIYELSADCSKQTIK